MTIYTIQVSVADLRREPVEAKRGYERDMLQESQLLYGERIQIHERHGSWLSVEALEQEKYYPDKEGWRGYFGWIKAEHVCIAKEVDPNLVVTDKWLSLFEEPDNASKILFSVSFGTQFQGRLLSSGWYELALVDGRLAYASSGLIGIGSQKVEDLFELVCQHFLGTPYLWGGSSAHSLSISEINTGVDCSGLSRLLYRAAGIAIPRDAKDQHLKLKKVLRPPKKCGDLYFTSDKGKIDHVMIYGEGNIFLESTHKAGGVRLVDIHLKNATNESPSLT
jgi:hypothetical protein